MKSAKSAPDESRVVVRKLPRPAAATPAPATPAAASSPPASSPPATVAPPTAAAPRSTPGHPAALSPVAPPRESAGLQWTFLTNHSHVLILLAQNPSLVLREVALQVGITERAVQRIIADLEAGGVIEREKVGRRNHYRIRTDLPLRHPVESHRTIGELLALVNRSDE